MQTSIFKISLKPSLPVACLKGRALTAGSQKGKHPSPKAPMKGYRKHRHTSRGQWKFLVHPLA